jgi:hypothetical protein
MIERIGAPEGQGMIRLVTGGNNCASLFIPLIRLKKLPLSPPSWCRLRSYKISAVR